MARLCGARTGVRLSARFLSATMVRAHTWAILAAEASARTTAQ